MLNKYNIRGVMIESHINAGSQKLQTPLKYGISITDGCIDIVTSNTILMILNNKIITHKLNYNYLYFQFRYIDAVYKIKTSSNYYNIEEANEELAKIIKLLNSDEFNVGGSKIIKKSSKLQPKVKTSK